MGYELDKAALDRWITHDPRDDYSLSEDDLYDEWVEGLPTPAQLFEGAKEFTDLTLEDIQGMFDRFEWDEGGDLAQETGLGKTFNRWLAYRMPEPDPDARWDSRYD